MNEQSLALEAIRKKLVGKKLSYKEIYAVMDEVAKDKLGDILTTYFVASGYSKGFSKEEIYFLTRAMVETGDKLHFKGIVADKHSIGGMPGTRTTLIVVPIIAACGYKIPKSSSRAITTPAGTADVMEVFSKVTFTEEEIYKIVEKTNACIVWGGSFNIAPADDEIIHVEEPLLFESYDKILVSVMAKKVAFGSTHVVIDLPYGKTVKLHRIADAEELKNKFEYLAEKFGIKMKVLIHRTDQPEAGGIGPVLEARESLKVLEQKEDRSKNLEERSVDITASLLKLCLKDSSNKKKKEIAEKYHDEKEWAKDILRQGLAHSKFKEIIEAQKGNPNIESNKLKPDDFSKEIKAIKSSKITLVNNRSITVIAKILGAPHNKKAGIYLHKRLGDQVEKGETILTFYAESRYKLNEARDSLLPFPIYEF